VLGAVKGAARRCAAAWPAALDRACAPSRIGRLWRNRRDVRTGV